MSEQLPADPPPGAYAVRGSDGLYYGWAQSLSDCIEIGSAIGLRSMLDLDIVDTDGNVMAHIGLFEPPPGQAEQLPLDLVAQPDVDDPLLVHFRLSEEGVRLDHGDGTEQTLHSTTEAQHRYAANDSYQITATKDGRTGEAWVTLGAPPTIDLGAEGQFGQEGP